MTHITDVILTYLINLFQSQDKSFVYSLIFSSISALFCSLIPHLQYKYKLISKLTTDDYGKGADLLAFILIYIGTYRNYSFIECVYNSETISLPLHLSYLLTLVGGLLILIGWILIISSFHKLGLRGMYFGDHFGFLFRDRINSFPYNYFENPVYIGSFCCYFGFSLSLKSVPGLILTLFILLCNQIVFLFNEKKKLKVFYPNETKKID